jgi:hypothetical protein
VGVNVTLAPRLEWFEPGVGAADRALARCRQRLPRPDGDRVVEGYRRLADTTRRLQPSRTRISRPSLAPFVSQ